MGVRRRPPPRPRWPAAPTTHTRAPLGMQAYWQFHLTATKSDLHCCMRQRLTTLRQQLQLARSDA